ncbi:MAG: glutathione peroxidase [Betaproteobacteria bacterium]
MKLSTASWILKASVVACAVLAAGLWAALPVAAQTPPATASPAACPPLLQHTVPRLQDDKPQNLCQYAGKVLLVVNTASYCGFTKQFEGLEELNARYGPRGLVVMGFPSGDFKQEDADAKKTAEVCFHTYGVKFPMFATGPVRGADAQPIFRQLAQATGQQPSWNFNKYLVGRDGKPIAHWGSMTGPTSGSITGAIEKALAARP